MRPHVKVRGSQALAAALVFALLAMSSSRSWAGSTIKSDEEVVFFPTSAHLEDGRWLAPIHGWIFEPEQGSLWRGALVQSLRAALGVSSAQEAMFRKRLRWFLVDNERGKKISVRAGGQEKRMPASKPDGHFRGTMEIPESQARGASEFRVRARTRKGDGRVFEGSVYLVPAEGLSIVSDIDDTIKVTEVHDRKRTLERTFLTSFKAVPGMASLYRRWQSQGASFHYVSASPWHLYVPLSRFMKRTAFPGGSMHLRDFRLAEKSRWNLLTSSAGYKRTAIEGILKRFPKRSFILVGDTGERDPEIYADLARRYPQQVQRILLRKARPNDISSEREERVRSGHRAKVEFFLDPRRIRTRTR